jgi:hypothetical protein
MNPSTRKPLKQGSLAFGSDRLTELEARAQKEVLRAVARLLLDAVGLKDARKEVGDEEA